MNYQKGMGMVLFFDDPDVAMQHGKQKEGHRNGQNLSF